MDRHRVAGKGFAVATLFLCGSSVVCANLDARELGTAPSVSKTFMPARIAPNGVSLVTITLSNPTDATATLTTELDDHLPSPMVIGGGAGTTTCAGGNMSAIGGFAIFALSLGAQIPANGSCTVTVCVTTDTADSYTNTIPSGALQTDAGNNADPQARTSRSPEM